METTPRLFHAREELRSRRWLVLARCKWTYACAFAGGHERAMSGLSILFSLFSLFFLAPWYFGYIHLHNCHAFIACHAHAVEARQRGPGSRCSRCIVYIGPVEKCAALNSLQIPLSRTKEASERRSEKWSAWTFSVVSEWHVENLPAFQSLY